MAPKKGSTEKALKDIWVILLCGLPGSGKSTLRAKIAKNGWSYVSQDELLTSDACEKAFIKALKAGSSCVVDRCNVTSSERRLWLQYAQRAVEKGLVKGVTIHFEAVWMATPPEICKERARSRQNHETLSSEMADQVIDDFCKGLRPPARSGQEPYEAVNFVSSDDDADIILKRYGDPFNIDTSMNVDKQKVVVEFDYTAIPATQTERHLPSELFIVRHAERADRAKWRDDGWADDPPLTKEGREMAKRAGAALRGLTTAPWAAVYSSPFYRCLQTANEIAAELQLPVRVEPGLSELCIERIFDQPPQLRSPDISLQSALTRTSVDCSTAPVQPSLPQWPEQARFANTRVLQTATELAARHPRQAICLVCHSHSLVELSRHLPSSGGGATASHADYCALSQVSFGRLVRCLDTTYMRESSASSSRDTVPSAGTSENQPCGTWTKGWNWVGDGASVDMPDVQVYSQQLETLFELSLDEVLEEHPAFRELFSRGSSEKQQAFRTGWTARDGEVRAKLQQAKDLGLLVFAT